MILRPLFGLGLFLIGAALLWRGDKIRDAAVSLAGITTALSGALILFG